MNNILKVGQEIEWTHGHKWDNDVIIEVNKDQYLTKSVVVTSRLEEYWWTHDYIHRNSKLVTRKEDLFDQMYKRLCF